MDYQSQTAPSPLPVHDLIALGTSSQALRQHVTCFPRLKETRPNAEGFLDFDALYNLVIANGRPAIWPDKSLVPMVLLGELKDEPYTGRTAKKYPGESGKQRSGTHVLLYGPGIMFDIDGVPVAEIEKTVKALGLAYIVYPSYSSGEESRDKAGKIKAKGRGRLVLFLDGRWGVDDHKGICRVIDRIVLGDVADPGAFSRGQAFYIAGLKHEGQEFYHNASHGQLLSLQAVLAQTPTRGRPKNPAVPDAASERAKATPDEAILQEAREIGAMGCVDDEPDWFRMVNSIKRTWPDRPEFALDVADAMSKAAAGYKGREDVESKIRDDDGHGTEFDFVQRFAKNCAIAIIERANADMKNVFSLRNLDGTPFRPAPNAKFVELAPGIKSPKVPTNLDISPESVRHAALHLARWHPPGLIDSLIAKYPTLAAHAAEIEKCKAERVVCEQVSANDEIEALVEEFNAKYAILGGQKSPTIMKFNADNTPFGEPYTFMSHDALRQFFQHRTLMTVDGKKSVNIVDVWLRHPYARRYEDGIAFDPSGRHKATQFNSWTGLAVQSKKGSWKQLRRHLRNVVCAKDSKSFRFLIRTMARAVQFPWLPAEVAVVMRGDEGVGKGVVCTAMQRLFGKHGLYITHEEQLVGRFNGHTHNKVFIFADEAFFAGNAKHAKILKSLITSEHGTFEFKGLSIFSDRQYLHLWMASNENWVVPVSLKDRRMFVLDVLPTMRGNPTYFKAIFDEMDNGGLEAMLHDLLKVALTGFDHRDIPKTAGLRFQQLQSLSSEEAWWYLCLDRGYIYTSKEGREDHFQQWHDFVTTDLLYASYVENAKAMGRRVVPRETLGRFLATYGTNVRRKGVIGERRRMSQWVPAELIEHPGAMGYAFDPLPTARAKFTAVTTLPFA